MKNPHETVSQKETAFEMLLEQVTELGQQKNIEQLSKMLELSPELLAFSASCSGEGLRKGTLPVGDREEEITHFSHMCRVASMVHHFFPEDLFSRALAMGHDLKEEPAPGKEDEWKNLDEVSKIEGLSRAVAILTEEMPTQEEIELAAKEISREFDAVYIAKYRTFLATLSEHWNTIGHLELCDRLDGATSFAYLQDPKYDNRRKYKALETFGRIWATLALSDNLVLTDRIKESCGAWFEGFDVTEEEVEKTATYFK